MAGNVKEWCWNELDRGRRWVRGGAWNEPIYMFVQPDAEVPLSRPDNVGFRCAKYLTQPPPKALAMRAKAFRDYRQVKPAPREEVEAFKSLYFIDSAVPLEPSNVSSDDLAEVIHETISVNSAHRPGKLVLHLFLPKGVKTPYQAIVYCPGAHAFDASSFKDAAWEWAPFVSNGRAVCLPTYMGMYERQVERQQSKLNWAREAFLEAARDARRAVDYLQSRKDIDGQSLAFVGGSWGATWAPIALAVEPRFKACVMITGGLHNTTFPPEVDPFNFAPQVVIPVLMLNGQYDWIFPVETSQEPLYRALGSKDKKIIRYESGHGLPKQAWSAAYEWLDEHFGLVARQPE
jgi:dipeptidyl aminopeptidase/acylaminoacyl peptidase